MTLLLQLLRLLCIRKVAASTRLDSTRGRAEEAALGSQPSQAHCTLHALRGQQGRGGAWLLCSAPPAGGPILGSPSLPPCGGRSGASSPSSSPSSSRQRQEL